MTYENLTLMLILSCLIVWALPKVVTQIGNIIDNRRFTNHARGRREGKEIGYSKAAGEVRTELDKLRITLNSKMSHHKDSIDDLRSALEEYQTTNNKLLDAIVKG